MHPRIKQSEAVFGPLALLSVFLSVIPAGILSPRVGQIWIRIFKNEPDYVLIFGGLFVVICTTSVVVLGHVFKLYTLYNFYEKTKHLTLIWTQEKDAELSKIFEEELSVFEGTKGITNHWLFLKTKSMWENRRPGQHQ